MLIVSFLLIGKNWIELLKIHSRFFWLSDVERERQREKEAERQTDERIQSKIHYQQTQNEKPIPTKSDQVAQTDHQVDRIVYIDEPIPKVPSIATKAFVRNLNSSSVQQQMLWDSDSSYSHRTNSDMCVFLFF
jgi:hypothetical protein